MHESKDTSQIKFDIKWFYHEETVTFYMNKRTCQKFVLKGRYDRIQLDKVCLVLSTTSQR